MHIGLWGCAVGGLQDYISDGWNNGRMKDKSKEVHGLTAYNVVFKPASVCRVNVRRNLRCRIGGIRSLEVQVR